MELNQKTKKCLILKNKEFIQLKENEKKNCFNQEYQEDIR